MSFVIQLHTNEYQNQPFMVGFSDVFRCCRCQELVITEAHFSKTRVRTPEAREQHFSCLQLGAAGSLRNFPLQSHSNPSLAYLSHAHSVLISCTFWPQTHRTPLLSFKTLKTHVTHWRRRSGRTFLKTYFLEGLYTPPKHLIKCHPLLFSSEEEISFIQKCIYKDIWKIFCGGSSSENCTHCT